MNTPNEDIPIDALSPEDEAFLQRFLAEAGETPPEGYEEQLWESMAPRLTPKKGFWPRLSGLVKGHTQLLSAAAVMIIAIVVPLKVLDTPFLKQSPSAQSFSVGSAPEAEIQDAAQPKESMVLGSGRSNHEQPVEKTEEESSASKSEVYKITKNEPKIGDYKSKSSRLLSRSNGNERRRQVKDNNGFKNGTLDLDQQQVARAPEAKKQVLKDKLADLKEMDVQPAKPSLIVPPSNSPTSTRHYNVQDYLVRRGSVRLEVPELQKGFQKISQVVASFQGFIVESEFRKSEKGQATATFKVKLPKASLMDALAQMEQEGIVREKQIKSEDVWLKMQKERLNTQRLNEQIAVAKQKKQDPKALKYQLEEQKLKNEQYQQMLSYATLYVTLFEKVSPYGSWVSDRTWRKLHRMVRDTTDMLVELLVILPPVLLFLGCAWVVWKLLSWALVSRLALVTAPVLGWIYVAGLVFFPVYFAGEGLLNSVLLFVSLIAFVWGANTFFKWFKNRQQRPPVEDVADTSNL